MPRKKARQKRNRKKSLELSVMLQKFDEMENTLEHSLLGINSEDDKSCSSSADSLTQTQNLSEIGESQQCEEVKETHLEKNNGKKRKKKAIALSLVHSENTFNSDNINIATILDDSYPSSESGSTNDCENFNLTSPANDFCVLQNSKSVVYSEKILSNTESVNCLNTNTVTSVEKISTSVKSESTMYGNAGLVDDSLNLKDSEPVNSENIISDANVLVEEGPESTSSEILDSSSRYSDRTEIEDFDLNISTNDSHIDRNLEPIDSKNIVSEATINAVSDNKGLELVISESFVSNVAFDEIKTIKNSDLVEIKNPSLNDRASDSPKQTNFAQIHSENIISEVIVSDSYSSKDQDFANSETCGFKVTLDNNVDISKNSDSVKQDNFEINVPMNDSYFFKNSDDLLISESDSIISTDGSRFSKNSKSVNSENNSSKKSRKRKRVLKVPNEIFDDRSGFMSESSLYQTPASHKMQSSFHDVKFYSNFSEIFNTPLSSRNSEPSKSESPLSFHSAKSSSHLLGESSPNLSCSFPCYTRLSGDFDLFSTSEPVLRNHSGQFENSSRSSSHIASLLKEKNYSITPFALSSYSDIDDLKGNENVSQNTASFNFPDQNFNKENEERMMSKRRSKKNVLKRNNRTMLDFTRVDSKSSSLLSDGECMIKDSALSCDKFSSHDFSLSLSPIKRLSAELNTLKGGETKGQSDFLPVSAVSSLPFTPVDEKESGSLRSMKFQHNSTSEGDGEISSQKNDRFKNNHLLMMASKFSEPNNRLDLGTSASKEDIRNHPGTPSCASSAPTAAPSTSLHQFAETCKRIAAARLPSLCSPPRWPIDFPLSRVFELISWIVKKTAWGVWSLRRKVSQHCDIDLSNVNKPQSKSSVQKVLSASPAKMNPCCSCQCLVSVMPKLISKIETLDSDIQQIKSLLVQKVALSSTFDGPPAPPPPPPPPLPPPCLMTPISINVKQNDKLKQDGKKKHEMTRPPITVEDLRRVTLRKTPLPQNKERKISTDPRCPVVSLEMLRSVKLRPRRRIIDSGGSCSIRSFLSKSSRERSNIIDRILNPVEDVTNDSKAHLADSDIEENPSKKSRTEVQEEKEESLQQT